MKDVDFYRNGFFFLIRANIGKCFGVLRDYVEKLSRLSGTNEHFHWRSYVYGARSEESQ
jgi:hypothetical protein